MMDWGVALMAFLGFSGFMGYVGLVWKLHNAVEDRFGETAAFLVWMIGGAGIPISVALGIIVAAVSAG
jgi:hypothetical protein